MDKYVDLLMDGSFKRLVLNPRNEEDELNSDIFKEMLRRKVSFEVRYNAEYNEYAFYLI